jgi:hypothetical protein
MNTWSVVVLIIGIATFAVGLLFKFLSDKTTEKLCEHAIEIRATAKRVEILERQADVIQNELTHINRKLDELLRYNKRK